MSLKTRQEVLTELRRQYAKAGPDFQRQIFDPSVRLLGYHRKSSIRALRAPMLVPGRPIHHEPARLQPELKPILFAAVWRAPGDAAAA